MAALSQDYKAQRRAAPSRRRLRDFACGVACGALLTGIACAWLGARAHGKPVPPLTQQAAPAANRASAAETFTFPDLLARSTVPVFPDKAARHAAPPLHRAANR